ncbi:PAQR family membrane homeostasis protein TrhA [Nocardioides piscis]|uniref:Hemolysin III family protein n=1 Tax=Nocardioides piscis TaxID=2714938 RepID=A0A6G7YCZ7_9ACTN|nr:hemolysin III family protein [Nocardioides piscis]QIK74675.1 hemolysin III family protein [Nocardioides piscis]
MTAPADRVDDALERAKAVMADKMAEIKPRLRGWMHAGSLPPMVVAFAVLIAMSPTTPLRVGSSIYAASALLLFGVSAAYHLGTWEPRVWAALRRFDHANIYVLIAGTYTPFAILYLRDEARLWLLATVWGLAVAGLVFRVAWINAPRWLFTPLYIGLGWVIVFFIPQLLDGADRFPSWVNVSVLSLVAAGGLIYTIGGVVYAAKRPNPSPAWFGFHEVFHLCTVLAFVAQYAAVSLATCSLR